jgi:hypothetical protein
MSDTYKKLIDTLKMAVNGEAALPLVPMEVKEITGETCVVIYGDLELTDVRLKATINNAANKVLLIPKVESFVLVGSLTGDLKDLAVLKVDELQKIQVLQDGCTIEFDFTTGKLEVSNKQVSLKGLFQSLVDLLKAFKVYTPSGPSGTALPNSITALNSFETDFKKLLK